jgi:hypothetical protein
VGRPEPRSARHGGVHPRGPRLTALRRPEAPAAALSAAALGAVATGAVAGGAAAAEAPTLCPFRLALGLPCPFCGLTHSLLAIGEGDIGQALSLHPLALLVPLTAGWLLVAVARALRSGETFAWPRPALVLGAALLAAAWVLQLERGVT